MSRTYRTRHVSPTERAKRGGTPEGEKRDPRKRLKSHKQERPNDRARLRKEYL